MGLCGRNKIAYFCVCILSHVWTSVTTICIQQMHQVKCPLCRSSLDGDIGRRECCHWSVVTTEMMLFPSLHSAQRLVILLPPVNNTNAGLLPRSFLSLETQMCGPVGLAIYCVCVSCVSGRWSRTGLSFFNPLYTNMDAAYMFCSLRFPSAVSVVLIEVNIGLLESKCPLYL